MIQTQAERQEWHDKLVARFAQPDEEVRVIAGRDWARVRPMYCANCGDLFYGWTPLDVPLPSYVKESGPDARQTCGHPFCFKADNERAYREVTQPRTT